MMDVLLSLEGEYILSTRLGGQDASPRDKVGDGLQILDYQSICNPNISLTSPRSRSGSVANNMSVADGQTGENSSRRTDIPPQS